MFMQVSLVIQNVAIALEPPPPSYLLLGSGDAPIISPQSVAKGPPMKVSPLRVNSGLCAGTWPTPPSNCPLRQAMVPACTVEIMDEAATRSAASEVFESCMIGDDTKNVLADYLAG